MADLVSDCPRCGAQRITFDVTTSHVIQKRHDWKQYYEAFAICRRCLKATIFVLSDREYSEHEYVHSKGLLGVIGALNLYVVQEGYVNIKNLATASPPEHLPADIDAAYREGATCLAVECFNAAGAMFRLCVDLATKTMLPQQPDGPPAKVRRNLGLRLPWLFENGKLPEGLRDLSTAVKEDGNDGAHDGTLTKEDAEDLRDFTKLLLERIYTEPERLKITTARREQRRNPPDDDEPKF